jgi:hypothetical protein
LVALQLAPGLLVAAASQVVVDLAADESTIDEVLQVGRRLAAAHGGTAAPAAGSRRDKGHCDLLAAFPRVTGVSPAPRSQPLRDDAGITSWRRADSVQDFQRGSECSGARKGDCVASCRHPVRTHH